MTFCSVWAKKEHFYLHLMTFFFSGDVHTNREFILASIWHVMTWECLIRAHGFNNAWVREGERGRARAPTRSNCLRNKTEQTSSLRKSLQENKLVTRLTPLTVLLSEAQNDNNNDNKKNTKKSPMQISFCVCVCVKFSLSFEMHIYKKRDPKPQLTLSLTSGDGRRKDKKKKKKKVLFLFESWIRLNTQAPQRKINQRHRFIKYTSASLSFVKIFNKYCWCKEDKKREGYWGGGWDMELQQNDFTPTFFFRNYCHHGKRLIHT